MLPEIIIGNVNPENRSRKTAGIKKVSAKEQGHGGNYNPQCHTGKAAAVSPKGRSGPAGNPIPPGAPPDPGECPGRKGGDGGEPAETDAGRNGPAEAADIPGGLPSDPQTERELTADL